MVWQQWVYVGYAIFGALLTVSTVGKPRQPATPGMAVCALCIYGLLAWLVVSI
jgi:hypothetical protein